MYDTVAAVITKSNTRKSLYHFTRASNLPMMANYDSLFSSQHLQGQPTVERRQKAMTLNYAEYSLTINAHLKIPDVMIDESTTQQAFRACLDRHVFLWPTLKDCRKMLDTYRRREPNESFAVLAFDAYSLMTACQATVKLSKYDSGSSPRFPHLCSYKKSPVMFLPLAQFKKVSNRLVPEQVSEIHEVLIEDRVSFITRYLRAIYIADELDVPPRWREYAAPLDDLMEMHNSTK
ncbi:DUF7002 family protein [Paenibacillus luteus]|uniref:DUF7002 family protein n=1 Tax=Paenibacillus luteus TaxID=2545753 RepID=UPI0011416E1E|nr:hypothetical protein [Paenibacillus luteus]